MTVCELELPTEAVLSREFDIALGLEFFVIGVFRLEVCVGLYDW